MKSYVHIINLMDNNCNRGVAEAVLTCTYNLCKYQKIFTESFFFLNFSLGKMCMFHEHIFLLQS